MNIRELKVNRNILYTINKSILNEAVNVDEKYVMIRRKIYKHLIYIPII